MGYRVKIIIMIKSLNVDFVGYRLDKWIPSSACILIVGNIKSSFIHCSWVKIKIDSTSTKICEKTMSSFQG